MPRLPGALILAAALCVGLPARADVVRLKNGGTLEGTVTETATEVRVRMPFGEMVVPRAQVAAIEKSKSPLERYQDQALHLATTDVDGHLRLARWCLDQGLRDAGIRELQQVLAVDPGRREAQLELDRLQGRALPQPAPGWAELATPHFLFRSEARQSDLRALEAPVEALVDAFADELKPAAPLTPLRGPFVVHVFTGSNSFLAYMKRTYPEVPNLAESSRESLRGFADVGREEVLAVLDPARAGESPETVLHEVTHLLAGLQLCLPRTISAPDEVELKRRVEEEKERMQRKVGTVWIDEGLANYFGGSMYEQGKLRVGVIAPHGDLANSLSQLQKSFREGTALRPNAIVAADANDFGGTEHEAYYAGAWTFVHFLLRADRGRYHGQFMHVIDDYRTGKGGVAAFRAAFGLEPNELAGAWERYVLELRTRE